jgi:hypothetical protein
LFVQAFQTRRPANHLSVATSRLEVLYLAQE